jgi:hypothetical protein
MRVRGRVVVVVSETSDWFRRALEPHLEENARVRIEAAEGYAYCLQARSVARPPVLARRLVFRWRAGQLLLESATGTNGRPVDLNVLFAVPDVNAKGEEREDPQAMYETPNMLEEVATAALEETAEDTNLSKSGLRPVVQTELAEAARQEGALRLALLARVQEADAHASALCVKLLGASFGGFDPGTELYQQAAAKLATSPYAPHLRDLLANLITSPRPSTLRNSAKEFCRHLEAARIETGWATELLKRA